MNNEHIDVTQDIIDDPKLNAASCHNCFLHSAIVNHFECNPRQVAIGTVTVDIGEKVYECSEGITEWQLNSISNGSNIDRLNIEGDKELVEKYPVEPITIVVDEYNKRIYIEGEHDE